MSLTIVHRASPSVVDIVLARFHEHGVEAVAVDQPSVISLFVAFGTYRVRIGVPVEQADEARRVLDEWERESAPRLASLEQRARRQFLGATLLTLAVGALVYLAGGLEERPHWLLALLLPLWFGLLFALGLYQRARARRA